MRVGQLQFQSQLLGSTLQTEADLTRNQAEASSGQSFVNLSDLTTSVPRLLTLSGEISSLQAASSGAKTVSRDLTATDAALSTLQNVAAAAGAALVQALGLNSPGTDTTNIKQQAKGYLDQVISTLNTQSEGRYIFNGLNPTTPPAAFPNDGQIAVDASTLSAASGGTLVLHFSDQPPLTITWPGPIGINDLATMVSSQLAQAGLRSRFSSVYGDASGLHLIGIADQNPPGGLTSASLNGSTDLAVISTRQQANPTTDYFTGPLNGAAPTRDLGQGVNLGTGVTANDPAIEELVRALRLAENVQTTPSLDTATLNQAHSLITQAISDLGTLQGRVGLLGNEADSAASSLDSSVTSLQSNVSDLTGADMASVMTQINQEQTQLQAAFMILSRLSSLTVLNELH
jgi:flagellar hook-associated protein 3 FlgL